VRLFADTNIVAPAVRALREAGHDVLYSAERPADPGDLALLAEATAAGRALITKDHDFGALVHRDGHSHAGVLLLDDLGDAAAETALIVKVLARDAERLLAGEFLRAP
jgi:predicted nuclease of predicted toxin-antitoxin system